MKALLITLMTVVALSANVSTANRIVSTVKNQLADKPQKPKVKEVRKINWAPWLTKSYKASK